MLNAYLLLRQILRSIDSFAADFDFSTTNLVKTIGRKVDPSIRWSYVHNVCTLRRAPNTTARVCLA
jgi:hypothetical protein